MRLEILHNHAPGMVDFSELDVGDPPEHGLCDRSNAIACRNMDVLAMYPTLSTGLTTAAVPAPNISMSSPLFSA